MDNRRRLMMIEESVTPDIPRDFPPEYQRVEYIQSATQGRNFAGINLGEKIELLKFTYDTEFSFITADVPIAKGVLIGGADSSQNESNMFFGTLNGVYSWGCGTLKDPAPIDYAFIPNELYNVKLTYGYNYKKLIINNTTVFDGAAKPSNLKRWFYIGSADYDWHSNDKLIKCKIWKNGELWKDLEAGYEKATNVAGMYDFVSQTFLKSTGGKPFLKGADI